MENNFFNFYNEYAEMQHKKFKVDSSLSKELIDKLDFGYSKYKEESYQGSEEKAMKVDIKNHIKGELIDTINYLFHLRYKYLQVHKGNEGISEIIETDILINTTLNMLIILSKLEEPFNV